MDLQLEVLGAAYGYRGVGMFVSRLATDWALRRARAVFVLGRCMRERVRRAGVPPERIRVLHNWASVEPQGCHLGDEFRQRHGLLGKFVVMYAGNLGLAHQFETILRSAAALRPDSRIAFVFVGHGMRRPEVAAVSAAGASSVYVVDSQPRSELAEVLSAADLHFISLRPGCEGLMVPSKFYGALAAARPVLYEGEGSGEVARLITEINCGTVVAPGDSAALTGAVSRYLQYPEERARAGSAAAAAYRTRFSRNIGSGEIVKEIQQLLRGVHRG
jgi:glycosyltransferase involved in cell wall biosynthesis